MSRAYRITVKESEIHSLKGQDEISTQLELLEILPPEAMAELLKGELQNNGFKEQPDGRLVRRDGALTVTVDPCNGEVSVKSELAKDVAITVDRSVTGFDDVGPDETAMRERVRDELKRDIQNKANQETERLQSQATETLERHLDELQPELSRVINKVTRDALKAKAAQLGSIQEIHEDSESGDLTIKIEV
ncbi:MAG: hypothetical protein LC104_15410 [Bacteroidales bacterium]|nr:hypothetical protein [Bacteroidales bacterium]